MTALCSITPIFVIQWLFVAAAVVIVAAIVAGIVAGVIDGIREDEREYRQYTEENPR